MSSYSDLATSIINKNGQGGKFSGLNTALDLRQAFKDAATQYAFQQQLAKEQGYNTGVAGIISQGQMWGQTPAETMKTVQNYQNVVNAGPNGQLPNASSLATNTNSPDNTTMPAPTMPSVPSSSSTTIPSSEPKSTYADPSQFNEAQAKADGKSDAWIANLKQYALADPNTGEYKRNAATLMQARRGTPQFALSQDLAKYAPNLDTQIASQQNQFKNSSWNKGPLALQRQAAENVFQHAATFKQYATELQNGNITQANRILNTWKNQTGNSSVNNAATFARVIAVEEAKLTNPTGVLNQKDEDDAKSTVPINASLQVSNDAVRNAVQIALPRVNYQLEQYKNIFGVYPPTSYSPEAIKNMKELDPNSYNQIASKLRINGVTQQPVADSTGQGGQGNTQIPTYDHKTQKLQQNTKTGEYRVVNL